MSWEMKRELRDDTHEWVRWLVTSVARSLEHASPEARRDVIVIQFLRDSIGQDRRRTGAWVAWNTDRRLREMQAIASNPAERASMEWNAHAYAEPPRDQIGDPLRDPEGAAALERYVRDTGLWYEDDERTGTLHELKLWDACSEALVNAAHALHDGVLEQLIGRDVPVFLEDNVNGPEHLQELNRRANPPQFYERLDRWSLTWHSYE